MDTLQSFSGETAEESDIGGRDLAQGGGRGGIQGAAVLQSEQLGGEFIAALFDRQVMRIASGRVCFEFCRRGVTLTPATGALSLTTDSDVLVTPIVALAGHPRASLRHQQQLDPVGLDVLTDVGEMPLQNATQRL